MTPEEEEILVERCVTARRAVDPRGERLHEPAFYDLPEEAREEVFRRTTEQRAMERALSDKGRSSTVEAVLRTIRGQRG